MAEVSYRNLGHDEIVTLVAQGWVLIEDHIGQWLCNGSRYEVLDNWSIQTLVAEGLIVINPICSAAHEKSYRLTEAGVKRASLHTDTTYYRVLHYEQPESPERSQAALIVALLVVFLGIAIWLLSAGLTLVK